MLFVRSDGRRFVIARRLEGARLLTEQLAGQGYELSETDWHKEASGIEPGATIADLAAGRPFGADTSWPGARLMDGELAELRVPLSEGDVRKLRWLGRRCGEVVEDVCQRIQPYMTERGIEALVSDGLMKHAIQPVGVRVAADDRIRSYGAALPSDTAKVNRYVLIDVCAARWGLHVAMARAVHFGRLPADLNHSMKAVATIAAGLWARTVPAATAGAILEAAARDYGAAGFGEEWLKQDQGGAIGYREHEWLPTLDSRRMLRSPQAFAWNPGAGGVWMRDTILVRGDQLEILTEIRDWPVIEARAMGRVYRIPAILVR
jgi:Xaa-Pro aminopeptidase